MYCLALSFLFVSHGLFFPRNLRDVSFLVIPVLSWIPVCLPGQHKALWAFSRDLAGILTHPLNATTSSLAPFLRRSFTMVLFLTYAASCKAVAPSQLTALTSAPPSSKRSITAYNKIISDQRNPLIHFYPPTARWRRVTNPMFSIISKVILISTADNLCQMAWHRLLWKSLVSSCLEWTKRWSKFWGKNFLPAANVN